jgi:hypothetical protein
MVGAEGYAKTQLKLGSRYQPQRGKKRFGKRLR